MLSIAPSLLEPILYFGFSKFRFGVDLGLSLLLSLSVSELKKNVCFSNPSVFDLSCLGLSKVQFPTACPFNSNDYAPLAIRSYFDSLFKILGHPSLLNATGRMTEKIVST